MCGYMFHNIFSIIVIILKCEQFSHLDIAKSLGGYKFAPTEQDYVRKCY